MIEVSHLTKRYGNQRALEDVSFEVGRGEVVGFLGPNGAGKTSTLRILAGFLGPTAGEVRVAGYDVVRDSFEARRRIGYMPESAALYPEMRVIEYLRFRAELKRVPPRRRTAYVEDAMARAGVTDAANRRIGHLSKGYRQRVALADALVAKPPIVILDEPTAGLDPNQIREVRTLVRELGREHTVVLSTHVLSEVEACATRVLLLHKGKLVAQGSPEAVRALRGSGELSLVVRGDPAAIARALAQVAGLGAIRVEGLGAAATDVARFLASFAGEGDEDAIAERAVTALVAGGFGVRRVSRAGGTLEDAFAALTRPERTGSDESGSPEDRTIRASTAA